MSLRSLEKDILAEAKKVTKREGLRLKDLHAWESGEGLEPEVGEVVVWLPKLRISVAIPKD